MGRELGDLISRKALMQDVEDTIKFSECVNHEREIIDCIQYEPPEDAEIVRHGKWEERTFFNGCTPDRDLFCSCCNHNHGWDVWKYCPYCGAKMDLE